MDAISQTTFSNAFSWIKMFELTILIKISLKFVPKGPINNIPALVQIMAWCRPGNKPLSEPMVVNLPTHICVARPQWVKELVIWESVLAVHQFLFISMFVSHASMHYLLILQIFIHFFNFQMLYLPFINNINVSTFLVIFYKPFPNYPYKSNFVWSLSVSSYGLCSCAKCNKYRKVSNIRRTKSQNLNASRLIL